MSDSYGLCDHCKTRYGNRVWGMCGVCVGVELDRLRAIETAARAYLAADGFADWRAKRAAFDALTKALEGGGDGGH
jgi:hypothetical protein